MQQKVQTYIQKLQLLTSDEPIIIGVSGGTDSVVLLDILNSLGYNCIIAHCNFHLRMEESDRDEEFVRNLAKQLKLPYYHIDFDTIKYASNHGISIEMAARDLRYNWFNELVENYQAQAVAVAHHADDSIETMLMNLVRGTGLRGLTGIKPKNKKIVRPLLGCTRSEIENYLIRNDLEHVEDSTNATIDYQRNKFRNEVIPLLIEINPSVRQTLYDSIERFEGNMIIYQQAIDKMEKLIVEKAIDLVKMDIELIKQQLHIPTVMYELLYPYGFNSATIEQITLQLDGESGKVFYSETHRLLKDRKHLIISSNELRINEVYTITQQQISINTPFSLIINKLVVDSNFKISKNRNTIHVDATLLKFPLQIRRWKEGDYFFPFGMSNRKKISDFFVDNKLSLIEKEQTWLLMSEEKIVWIIGMRLDNRFRINDNTKEVIEFNYRPI